MIEDKIFSNRYHLINIILLHFVKKYKSFNVGFKNILAILIKFSYVKRLQK
jgi:hypothetical protein